MIYTYEGQKYSFTPNKTPKLDKIIYLSREGYEEAQKAKGSIEACFIVSILLNLSFAGLVYINKEWWPALIFIIILNVMISDEHSDNIKRLGQANDLLLEKERQVQYLKAYDQFMQDYSQGKLAD